MSPPEMLNLGDGGSSLLGYSHWYGKSDHPTWSKGDMPALPRQKVEDGTTRLREVGVLKWIEEV